MGSNPISSLSAAHPRRDLRPSLAEHAVRALGARSAASHTLDVLHRRCCAAMVRRWKRAHPPRREMLVAGVPLILELAEPSLAMVYLGRGVYEPRTAEVIRDHLGPGMMFVDVGANRGLFTLLAATRTGPAGRVIAVEPNPTVVGALRAHLLWNGLGARVELRELALADHDGDAALTLPTNSAETALASLRPSAFALEHRLLDPDRTIRVRTTTFDALMADAGKPTVDLVKIDAENAEDLVVAGMARTLASHPPRAIICETTHDSAAAAALAGAGYRITPLDVSAEGHGNYLFERAAAAPRVSRPSGAPWDPRSRADTC